jgi:hypothetical protein
VLFKSFYQLFDAVGCGHGKTCSLFLYLPLLRPSGSNPLYCENLANAGGIAVWLTFAGKMSIIKA